MNEPANERWLPVVGYEGRYEVSDQGRVRSVERWVEYRSGRSRVHPSVLLSPAVSNRYGHLAVNLWKRNQGRSSKVHSLVAEAFLGPRPPGMEVRHGPGGKHDNRLANLSYGTYQENREDMKRDGTAPRRGKKTRCKRNHPLEAPNLVESRLAQGYRTCLACTRAIKQTYQARLDGVSLDLDTVADEHYSRLVAEHEADAA